MKPELDIKYAIKYYLVIVLDLDDKMKFKIYQTSMSL